MSVTRIYVQCFPPNPSREEFAYVNWDACQMSILSKLTQMADVIGVGVEFVAVTSPGQAIKLLVHLARGIVTPNAVTVDDIHKRLTFFPLCSALAWPSPSYI